MIWMRIALFFLLGNLLAIYAQDGTTFQEQSARLQSINAFLLDFRPATAPRLPEENHWQWVLDINPQPSIDTRVGNKDEPIDPPSVVPKLRFRYLTRSGLHIGAAFAPGIEFEDYEAKYYSLELGYRFKIAGLDGALRASYSDGDVLGPITEPDVEDRFDFRNIGSDFSLGYSWPALSVYGFAGWNDIETELEVDSDGALLSHEESTYYGGLGVAYYRGHWSVTLEQNITDDYLKHVILGIAYKF